MENQKQTTSMELLQEAQNLGLLDLESTISCSNCHASFPKEYVACPSCKTGIFVQDLKIEFEI
jgi:hypothetical protein